MKIHRPFEGVKKGDETLGVRKSSTVKKFLVFHRMSVRASVRSKPKE